MRHIKILKNTSIMNKIVWEKKTEDYVYQIREVKEEAYINSDSLDEGIIIEKGDFFFVFDGEVYVEDSLEKARKELEFQIGEIDETIITD